MGYRVHQWQKTDVGVVGRSSAIGRRVPESPEEGLVWAKHCAEEIGNWGAFLPQLYALYRVVDRPELNPYPTSPSSARTASCVTGTRRERDQG